MANKLPEFDNKDSALARLLINQPTSNISPNSTPEDSTIEPEDFEALANNSLSDERRKQVLQALNSNANVYREWIVFQSQYEAGTASEPEVESHKFSMQQQRPSLIERITQYFEQLFAWPSMVSAAAGFALGILVLFNIDSQQVGDEGVEVVQLNEPVSAPMKAYMDQAPVVVSGESKVLKCEEHSGGAMYCLTSDQDSVTRLYLSQNMTQIPVQKDAFVGQLNDFMVVEDRVIVLSKFFDEHVVQSYLLSAEKNQFNFESEKRFEQDGNIRLLALTDNTVRYVVENNGQLRKQELELDSDQ